MVGEDAIKGALVRMENRSSYDDYDDWENDSEWNDVGIWGQQD